jgi:hypothetical protein
MKVLSLYTGEDGESHFEDIAECRNGVAHLRACQANPTFWIE